MEHDGDFFQRGGGPPGRSDDDPRIDLGPAVADMMEAAWRAPGFCVPNQDTYPHQWLWDSCFHAVIWCGLGSPRAVDRAATELTSALARQTEDGFVPHMIYWAEPDLHADFWGRWGASSITQPPMYGHAIAEVARAGGSVPDDVMVRAERGLAHLVARTRTPAGLIPVFHPWETGCDDSARWDDWRPESAVRDGDQIDRWRRRKGDLVASLTRGPDGQAVGNPEFTVGSVGFNALVAWNIGELLSVVARSGSPDPDRATAHRRLRASAEELVAVIASRWQGDRWVDDGPGPSGRVRTLDAMAPLLVDPRDGAFDDLIDPDRFGAPFGPRGVDRREPSYDPDTYWRGPAWPQLSYLMTVAAERAGRSDVAGAVSAALVDGARRSGLAEYWNPETGEGRGARPQTWAGLGLVASDRPA